MDYTSSMESAVGLFPTKMGYDDKVPAYKVKRNSFWKVATVVILLLLGVTALYFGASKQLGWATKELKEEIVGARRVEHTLHSKLAAMELELESILQQERREGVMANWVHRRLSEARVEHEKSVEQAITALVDGGSITEDQSKTVLQAFEEEKNRYTNVVEGLAHKVLDKMEKQARAAQHRLNNIGNDFDKVVKSEAKLSSRYANSNFHISKDEDGDGFADNVYSQSMDEDHHQAHAEHRMSELSLHRAVENFFKSAAQYDNRHQNVDLTPEDDLFEKVQALYMEGLDLGTKQEQPSFPKLLEDFRARLAGLQEGLKAKGIEEYTPDLGSELDYLRFIIVRAKWPSTRSIIDEIHGAWSGKQDAMNILGRIHDEVKEDNIPMELLYNNADWYPFLEHMSKAAIDSVDEEPPSEAKSTKETEA